MNFFNRMLLGLYSLSFLILSVIVGFVAAGWTIPLDYFESMLLRQDQRASLILISLIFIVISVKFLINSIGTKNVSSDAIVTESSLGQVRITIQALENLVKKTVLQVGGIREVRPRIITHPEGVGVFIHIVIAPDLEIPRVSNDIQDKVKEKLIQVAGVDVKTVKILVDNFSPDVKVKNKLN